jgi:hypothetical protein
VRVNGGLRACRKISMHRTNTGTYIHYMTRLCMMQLTDLATAAVAKEIPACREASLVCLL